MNLSKYWLEEWVEVKTDVNEMAHAFTMAGLEVDAIEVGYPQETLVVGQVLEVSAHPDADKLRITRVDVGMDVPLQIVCGAPNVAPGIKVPVALIGTTLGDIRIKKSRLRGVESFGMLCAASEIGLPEREDGLMILPAKAPLGVPVMAYLKLDGAVFDLNVTPNRGDCLSILGLAREWHAITSCPLKKQPNEPFDAFTTLDVGVLVDAPHLCPFYALAQLEVTNAKSSILMLQRLLAMGVRPHDALVDITNYVMLELGQPLHAFDKDAICGDISVRLAYAGESVTLLNDQEITCVGDELVIADTAGILALAGIMGAKRGSVTLNTRTILLEAAHFTPEAIAGRARRFGLHTDASARFERGVDPQMPARALASAIEHLKTHADAKLIGALALDARQEDPMRIVLECAHMDAVLGDVIDPTHACNILTRLGMDTHLANHALTVTVPSHRFDMHHPQDVIEEVARIYGYDRLQGAPFSLAPALDETKAMRQDTFLLKSRLAAMGYSEVVSFGFCDPKHDTLFACPDCPDALALANPISSDLAVMRRSLLSSLIPLVLYNLKRQQVHLKFFEMGQVFLGLEEDAQHEVLALVATDVLVPDNHYKAGKFDFFDLKADVLTLFAPQVSDALEFVATDMPFLHPYQSADIFQGDVRIGYLGQLHPSICQSLDLEVLWVAQLDANAVQTQVKSHIAPVSKYPAVRRDLAIIVDETVSFSDIEKMVWSAATKTLKRVHLFDVYSGTSIGAGKCSYALALIWQDDKTLDDKTIKEAFESIICALTEGLGAILRDG